MGEGDPVVTSEETHKVVATSLEVIPLLSHLRKNSFVYETLMLQSKLMGKPRAVL